MVNKTTTNGPYPISVEVVQLWINFVGSFWPHGHTVAEGTDLLLTLRRGNHDAH
jgi:hypothetical protein